jgi:hypothetical protein
MCVSVYSDRWCSTRLATPGSAALASAASWPRCWPTRPDRVRGPTGGDRVRRRAHRSSRRNAPNLCRPPPANTRRPRRLDRDSGAGIPPRHRLWHGGRRHLRGRPLPNPLTPVRRRIAEALDAVAGGLGLWRGTAYAEFADEDWIQPEAIRLDELRVEAEEIRLACLLDLGRHDEAVPALAAFVETHPLRESARLLLVTALYRTGRQADALRAADAYRTCSPTSGWNPPKSSITSKSGWSSRTPTSALAPRRAVTSAAIAWSTASEATGQAEVHTALQPGIDRLVAITSYPAAVADHPTFIREFDTKVREVARLDHPGLVEILDFWREPGTPTSSPDTRAEEASPTDSRRAPLPADTVARIAVQVAGALAEAHMPTACGTDLCARTHPVRRGRCIRVAGVGTSEHPPGHLPGTRRPRSLRSRHRPTRPRPDRAVGAHRLRPRRCGQRSGVQSPTRAAGARRRSRPCRRPQPRRPVHRHRRVRPQPGRRARDRCTRTGHRSPDQSLQGPPTVSRDRQRRLLRAGGDGLRVGVADATERFLTVVGASGSGKSSVVLAGVVPRIRSPRTAWHPLVASMVPGSSPFDELTRALRSVVPLERGAGLDAASTECTARSRAAVGTETLVLVIDQLEELWTLVTDPTERTRFITGLMDAVDDERLSLRVVATLRADFFDRPLQHHRWARPCLTAPRSSPPCRLQRSNGPSSSRRLQSASPWNARWWPNWSPTSSISRPPLPLLQFSLTELFEACDGVTISMEDHTNSAVWAARSPSGPSDCMETPRRRSGV